MKRFFACFLCVAILWGVFAPVPVRGAEEDADYSAEQKAEEISTKIEVIDSAGFVSTSYLFDSKRQTGKKTDQNASITLAYQGGIGSLYLTFERGYGAYTVTNKDTDQSVTVGENYFAHDFLDLVALFGSAPGTVTLSFDNGPAALYEIDVYSVGQVPDDVQIWEPPAEGKTDLVLFSAHSDDDQLFFLGLLPYYAVERNYQVQVVYLTNHWNSQAYRIHEALDGLWAVGIRAYPVFGPYPDFGVGETVEDGFREFEKNGFTREQMTDFVVEQLRRLRPQVAVGHDFNGEYGHVQHKVYARLLADAVEICNDPTAYPETAEKYGVWDVPKTYIHLYQENKIVMDWDQPMKNFDGMTPYEVARDLGFAEHTSQHRYWYNYFKPSKAAWITWQSPCQYGLYRTTVGPDVEKNDFFENLTSYGEQDILAALETVRNKEEAARKAIEEANRKAAEEAQRLAEEQAKLAEEERARQEEAKIQAEAAQREEMRQKEKQQTAIQIALLAGIAVLIAIVALVLWKGMRKRKHKAGKFLK